MELKKCTICKEMLPKTDECFAERKDRKNKCFQSSCRKCHKEYRKIHYLNNKKKYIKKAKVYSKMIFDWFQEIRTTLSCEKCGESRYWVLDFHHLDKNKKEGNVVIIARESGSKKRVIEEMKKCKVLCSNCHRDLHHKEKSEI